jgi:DNA-directed RNA polymerase specialized sigma24 family protein
MCAAAATVDADDLSTLNMLLSGTPPADIAGAMRVPSTEVAPRLRRMLARLHVPAAGKQSAVRGAA